MFTVKNLIAAEIEMIYARMENPSNYIGELKSAEKLLEIHATGQHGYCCDAPQKCGIICENGVNISDSNTRLHDRYWKQAESHVASLPAFLARGGNR